MNSWRAQCMSLPRRQATQRPQLYGGYTSTAIALRHRCHAGADLLHPARVLVAEDAGQRHAGRLHQPLDRVQVRGANPGAADPDEHVRGR